MHRFVTGTIGKLNVNFGIVVTTLNRGTIKPVMENTVFSAKCRFPLSIGGASLPANYEAKKSDDRGEFTFSR
jgi:hypothetical protein